MQVWRKRFNRRLRLRYGQALAYTLRRPKRFSAALPWPIGGRRRGAGGDRRRRVQFFAFDPMRDHLRERRHAGQRDAGRHAGRNQVVEKGGA
jgi:hypothetical protein